VQCLCTVVDLMLQCSAYVLLWISCSSAVLMYCGGSCAPVQCLCTVVDLMLQCSAYVLWWILCSSAVLMYCGGSCASGPGRVHPGELCTRERGREEAAHLTPLAAAQPRMVSGSSLQSRRASTLPYFHDQRRMPRACLTSMIKDACPAPALLP
jgi:hypothetical protein